jgi:hypothetical protein
MLDKIPCKYEYLDSRDIVKINAKGKSYEGINENNKVVCMYKLDGNMKTYGKICDNLFLLIDNYSAYFIELKGKDFSTAIDQIAETIDLLLPFLENYSVNVRIVLSRVNAPFLLSTKIIRFKKNIKRLNGNMRYSERLLQEKI